MTIDDLMCFWNTRTAVDKTFTLRNNKQPYRESSIDTVSVYSEDNQYCWKYNNMQPRVHKSESVCVYTLLQDFKDELTHDAGVADYVILRYNGLIYGVLIPVGRRRYELYFCENLFLEIGGEDLIDAEKKCRDIVWRNRGYRDDVCQFLDKNYTELKRYV